MGRVDHLHDGKTVAEGGPDGFAGFDGGQEVMRFDDDLVLVAGAVAGGGLTVIANAPNPAGVALLRAGFDNQSIGAGGLLLGALLPTAVAAATFLFL